MNVSLFCQSREIGWVSAHAMGMGTLGALSCVPLGLFTHSGVAVVKQAGNSREANKYFNKNTMLGPPHSRIQLYTWHESHVA